jgi:hypothetical protein
MPQCEREHNRATKINSADYKFSLLSTSMRELTTPEGCQVAHRSTAQAPSHMPCLDHPAAIQRQPCQPIGLILFHGADRQTVHALGELLQPWLCSMPFCWKSFWGTRFACTVCSPFRMEIMVMCGLDQGYKAAVCSTSWNPATRVKMHACSCTNQTALMSANLCRELQEGSSEERME